MTDRAIEPDELEAVLAHYPVGDLIAPPESGGGTANANLKIRTASGAYFLKRRNPRYAQPGFVAFDHALMEHLARYRVATPLALISRQGRRWVEISRGVYELFPSHPGGPTGGRGARPFPIPPRLSRFRATSRQGMDPLRRPAPHPPGHRGHCARLAGAVVLG
jgi:Ser/Thr protein kinase RdoA (MazF antagonist)